VVFLQQSLFLLYVVEMVIAVDIELSVLAVVHIAFVVAVVHIAFVAAVVHIASAVAAVHTAVVQDIPPAWDLDELHIVAVSAVDYLLVHERN